MTDSVPRILLVSSAMDLQNTTTNKEFAARLAADFGDRFSLQIANYDDIAFTFEPGAPKAFLLDGDVPLSNFDLIYIKSYRNLAERATTLVACLKAEGIPFIGEELASAMSLTKLSQYARLCADNLPLPKAMFVATPLLETSYDRIVASLGTPFVLKDIGGRGGELNFLIRDKERLAQVVHDHADVSFVAQTFIANDGDVRVLVVGGKAAMVIGRARLDDSTHLNNTSQGAAATTQTLDEFGAENAALAERAAALFKREIAGVDVMFEKTTGKAYILEVNSCPQVASGAFINEKTALMGEYLAREAARSVAQRA